MPLSDRLFLETQEPRIPEVRQFARQQNPQLFTPDIRPIGSRFATQPQQVTANDRVRSIAGPISGGLTAAAQAGPSYDTPSALVNVGTSTLGGVASGALLGAKIGAAGGPITALGGAAIGGGVALISSGLQAWLNVSQENKRRREIEKFQKQVQEKRRRQDRLARLRESAAEKKARRDAALQNRWARTLQYRNQINNLIMNSQELRDRYIKTGVR